MQKSFIRGITLSYCQNKVYIIGRCRCNMEISKKLQQILNRILQSAKPVKNLVRFFANLTTSKTKQSKALNSHLKISKKISSEIQIKKVDHKQQTAITSFFEKTFGPVKQSPPTVITVSAECIHELEPGIVVDACAFMCFEHFQEIRKYGPDMMKKLKNETVYVLDTTKKEYHHKNCPKDRFEMVRDVEYTGKPRNFNNTLAELLKSLGVNIYYVEVESSKELRKKANECFTKFRIFRLHKPDDMYLAFACVTQSTVLTLDGGLIYSSKKAKVRSIDFHKFLDKIMEKAPMTIIAGQRVELKKKLAHSVLTYGNSSSFKRDY